MLGWLLVATVCVRYAGLCVVVASEATLRQATVRYYVEARLVRHLGGRCTVPTPPLAAADSFLARRFAQIGRRVSSALRFGKRRSNLAMQQLNVGGWWASLCDVCGLLFPEPDRRCCLVADTLAGWECHQAGCEAYDYRCSRVSGCAPLGMQPVACPPNVPPANVLIVTIAASRS